MANGVGRAGMAEISIFGQIGVGKILAAAGGYREGFREWRKVKNIGRMSDYRFKCKIESYIPFRILEPTMSISDVVIHP
jgi:hypothetical protein